MFSSLKKLFLSHSDRAVRDLSSIASEVINLAQEMGSLSEEELKNKTASFREMLSKGASLDDILVPAFAVVREMSRRVLIMEHFHVQVMGGVALHRGMIAEMKTGEGKTLVATLPAYLNALSGKGVHIVTVNDYLVQRDAKWMGPLYEALGLAVKYVVSGMSEKERQDAYNADITYITSNELVFDFLRDNMKFDRQSMVQRGLHFANVDEIDSILIDDAGTPLIISGPVDESNRLYNTIKSIVLKLDDTSMEIDEKLKSVFLNDAGNENAELLLSEAGIIKEGTSLYDIENIKVLHTLDQSMKAHKLFFQR